MPDRSPWVTVGASADGVDPAADATDPAADATDPAAETADPRGDRRPCWLTGARDRALLG
jgi:hypothetical protein